MVGCCRPWCLNYAAPLGTLTLKPNLIPNPNPNPKITRNGRQYQSSSGSTAVKSPSLVELEYADLNLKEKYGNSQLGHVRIRQHVNPLSSSFSAISKFRGCIREVERLNPSGASELDIKPVPAPDWKEVFEDSTLPLMVDIGCGSGRFLIWLAKNSSESLNYLGLEIRQKLVQRSQFWVKDLALRNIHFMSANATISFEHLVSSYPAPLTFVSILCPDPHFKKRHHKRRVMQKPLVDSISKILRTGGQVFMQSDVEEVAIDMRTQFDSLSEAFKHIDVVNQNFFCDEEGWLLQNPMNIRTEREIHAELEGSRIYRRMYVKQSH